MDFVSSSPSPGVASAENHVILPVQREVKEGPRSIAVVRRQSSADINNIDVQRGMRVEGGASENPSGADSTDEDEFVFMSSTTELIGGPVAPPPTQSSKSTATTGTETPLKSDLMKDLISTKIKCTKEKHWLFHEKRDLVQAKLELVNKKQQLLEYQIEKIEAKRQKTEKRKSEREEKRLNKAQKKQARAEKRNKRHGHDENDFTGNALTEAMINERYSASKKNDGDCAHSEDNSTSNAVRYDSDEGISSETPPERHSDADFILCDVFERDSSTDSTALVDDLLSCSMHTAVEPDSTVRYLSCGDADPYAQLAASMESFKLCGDRRVCEDVLQKAIDDTCVQAVTRLDKKMDMYFEQQNVVEKKPTPIKNDNVNLSKQFDRLRLENANLKTQLHELTQQTEQQLESVFREVAEVSASEIVLREENLRNKEEIARLKAELEQTQMSADGDQMELARNVFGFMQELNSKQALIDALTNENRQLKSSRTEEKPQNAAAEDAELHEKYTSLRDIWQQTVICLNQEREVREKLAHENHSLESALHKQRARFNDLERQFEEQRYVNGKNTSVLAQESKALKSAQSEIRDLHEQIEVMSRNCVKWQAEAAAYGRDEHGSSERNLVNVLRITDLCSELRHKLNALRQMPSPDAGYSFEQLRDVNDLIERMDTICAHVARHGERELGGEDANGKQCELCHAYDQGKRYREQPECEGFYS